MTAFEPRRTPVTPQDLVGCRYRLVQRARLPEVAATEASRRRTERAEQAIHAALALLPTSPALGDNKNFLRIDAAHDEFATLEAIAAGATLITNARFAGAELSVTVEVLVRDNQPGPYSAYTPVIVSTHRVARPQPAAETGRTPTHTTWGVATQRLGLGPRVAMPFKLRHHAVDGYRLAAAARFLTELGVNSGWGGAIGQDLHRCFMVRTQPLQPALERALQQPTPTAPVRKKECSSCRFWFDCRRQLEDADDLSLLLPGDRGRTLRERGIDTVQELIDARLGEPSELAVAWRRGINLLRRREELAPLLSTPRDVEIDVDMEAFLDVGAYLWGTFDGHSYRPFVTWEPLGTGKDTDPEAVNFAQFAAYIRGRRRQAAKEKKSFAVFCYSAHGENHWLLQSARRFAGREIVAPDPLTGELSVLPIPTVDQVKRFIGSPQWVDVFKDVKANLTGPAGLGLKVVAPAAGFEWREEDMDGEASVHAYRLAVPEAFGTHHPHPEQVRSLLLSYNEDDCRATRAVRQLLRSGARQLPLLSQQIQADS